MSQLHLLGERRFWPLFWTQFLGAFNDNLFKNALVILVEGERPRGQKRGGRLALERLGARSAWMVGDTPSDVAAGAAAGVRSILLDIGSLSLRPGQAAPPRFSAADLERLAAASSGVAPKAITHGLCS